MIYELRDDHIAIIGLAGRFPGARDVREYWQNLMNGVDSISTLTDDELRARGVAEREINHPNYIKAAALIEGMADFDAAFFGFTPLEAKIRDPQARLFLETCHAALEDAGWVLSEGDGVVGVFGGGANDLYGEHYVKRNRAIRQAAGEMGIDVSNHPDYLATGVAYRLGLQGPAVNVMTACSTSLVAVHLACQSLRLGDCDLALAGGVEVELPYGAGHTWIEGSIFAKGGRCRAFDAKADGTLFGTGVGVVTLKRLADARADGDHIYAVIRGSAVNNDGSARVGFTAPGVEGQTKLITEALAAAEVTPDTISYVEAHGTGTLVGDPIEVAGLTRAYHAAGTTAAQFCAISSVKSNIGHLGPAAGAAGLIKACLAFEHGELPPSIHFDEPNPAIDFANTPFFVHTEPRPWARGDQPRRAGVSSFGIGGTNAHLILEEPPAEIPMTLDGDDEPDGEWHILPVSARTPAALDQAALRMAEHLKAHQDLSVADVAHSLQTGRVAHRYRRAAVARGTADGAGALSVAGGPRLITNQEPARPRTVAFMLPGQGSQYVGMGRDLYAHHPGFRYDVTECAELLQPALGFDLRGVLFPPDGQKGQQAEAAELLAQTRVTQPALFVIEYAMARLLMSWGIRPEGMIGHSVGELVAATLAEVFSLYDALDLVAARGELMQAMPPGAMMAVPMPEQLLRPYLFEDVEITAVNGPNLTTVAGPSAALDSLAEALGGQGVQSRPLHTSHAFHSAMMEPVVPLFREAVAKVTLSRPVIPFVSNITGTWITDEQATDPGYWAEQLRRPVRFADGLSTLAGRENLALAEVGPGGSLTSMARQCLRGQGFPIVPTMHRPRAEADDRAVLAEAGARLWTAGVELDWRAMRAAAGCRPGRTVSLPGYPYERQRFWVDPDPEWSAERGAKEASAVDVTRVLPIEEAFFSPVWREAALPPGRPAPDPDRRWLVLSPGHGPLEALAQALRAAGVPVTTAEPGADFEVLDGDRVRLRPAHRADFEALLDRFADTAYPTHVIHGWTATAAPPEALDNDHIRAVTDSGFYALTYLAQAIDRRRSDDPVEITVISAGLQQVSGDEDTDPIKALIVGPMHGINREMSGVSCRIVDIHPSPALPEHVSADQLLAEIHTRTDETQVAWRGCKRWTWAHEKLPSTVRPDKPAVLTERGVYLITGGLGGIGLIVAHYLARVVGARLVLVGRSPFPERSAWEDIAGNEEADPRRRDQIRRLLDIEAVGGEVMVASCDVTDEAQLRAVAAAARDRFGSIDGVFHSAAVSAGGMLTVKTCEDMERVLGPKVAGTLALHRVLGSQGAFLVLFSSIDAVVGNFGLSDYCGANNFLDAFARRAAARGEPVLSVGWGVWGEVGMAEDTETAVPALFRDLQRGVRSEDVDLTLLDRRVHDRTSDIIYSTTLDPDAHWVLTDHRIAGRAVLPGTYCLEVVHEAFSAAVGGDTVEISDIVFFGPIAIPDQRELRVVLRENGDGYDVTILTSPLTGPPKWTEHVAGRVRAVSLDPAPRHDLKGLQEACDAIEFDQSGQQSSGIVAFGDHWDNVGVVRVGKGQEIAELSLKAAHHEECDQYTLHPSLLDDAVSNAQYLPIEGDERYLPFAYEKVLVRRALPPRIHSHIRHLDSADGQIISSDVTLMDDDGQELVRIEGYSIRRVDPESITATVRAHAGAAEVAEVSAVGKPREERQTYSWSITPDFGLDALGRLLDGWPRPHVVVSREELASGIRRIAGVTSEVLEQELSDAELGQSVERFVDTPFVEPETEVQRLLASLSAESLGVDAMGIDDDFFELGGNSLVAVQLGTRIRSRFKIELPVGVIFEQPTVRKLAEHVEAVLLDKVASLSDDEAAQMLALTEGQ
ncbi:SDR family NAD(P)-dependent oxidoreductase [Streptomyces sp. NPDC059679]|uniref:SDR family NAD(P)-dependent oxidoreductase n=1 Tax=Streptomyces sp. NPDC059679 TaxID=3346903 RepID=UPI00368F3772